MKKTLFVVLSILFVGAYSQGISLIPDNTPAQTITIFSKYKLYVFADDSAMDKSGDLKIQNLTGKSWDYEWFYFKDNNYVQIPDANGVKISDLASGYYKVVAKEQGNSSNQQIAAAYILNVWKPQIDGIQQEDKYRSDCDSMKLYCSISKKFSKKTVIKDFEDTTQHYFYNYAMTYKWSSKTIDETKTYTPNTDSLLITGDLIPRERASFVVQITDGINNIATDSLSVATIHVNPKYEIFDTTSTMYDRTYVDGEPMVIKLRNTSSTKANWKKFEWKFYAKDVLLEKITKNVEQTNEDNANENFAVTIKRSGENTIKLVATSQLACVDSATVLKKTLNTANYSIPQAFTPSESSNNIFKLYGSIQGIISFDARIFNRWGQEVYRWSNPDDGWDGTIGGREASAGTYYYRFIIVNTSQKEDKTGPLLLIR